MIITATAAVLSPTGPVAQWEVSWRGVPIGTLRQHVSPDGTYLAAPPESHDWAWGFATKDDAANYLRAVYEQYGRN